MTKLLFAAGTAFLRAFAITFLMAATGTLLEQLLSAIESTATAEWREAARKFDRAQVPLTRAPMLLPFSSHFGGCPFDSVRSRTAR